MDLRNFTNLLKSQSVRAVAVDEVYNENDTYYNSGVTAGIEIVISDTVIEQLRKRFKLFIWISPVAAGGDIIGYTYEMEFANQLNNTISDMEYLKYPEYHLCLQAAVNRSFQHAYENKYKF